MRKEGNGLMDNKRSVLRRTTPKELKEFKWSQVMKEFRRKAPTLHQMMTAAIGVKGKAAPDPKLHPILGTALSMLLRPKAPTMSAVQHIIGIILFLGGLKKKVRDIP